MYCFDRRSFTEAGLHLAKLQARQTTPGFKRILAPRTFVLRQKPIRMGAGPLYKNRSIEEYLSFEEDSDEKHEYYQGEIFMMAGASINHSRIVSNSIISINAALNGNDCEIFTGDLRIQVEIEDLFTYPDLTVLCCDPSFYEGRTDTITNPTVLVEVLSPSTKHYDRNQKFAFYRMIPSLKAYLMISTDAPFVEVYSRLEKGSWELTPAEHNSHT